MDAQRSQRKIPRFSEAVVTGTAEQSAHSLLKGFSSTSKRMSSLGRFFFLVVDPAIGADPKILVSSFPLLEGPCLPSVAVLGGPRFLLLGVMHRRTRGLQRDEQ
jgi:hypothetical protein